MGAIIARLGAWWATRAASNYLLAAGVAAAFSLVVYIQYLQGKVNDCKDDARFAARIAELAEPANKAREQQRDEAKDQIDDADHHCLDVPVADLLRDEATETD